MLLARDGKTRKTGISNHPMRKVTCATVESAQRALSIRPPSSPMLHLPLNMAPRPQQALQPIEDLRPRGLGRQKKATRFPGYGSKTMVDSHGPAVLRQPTKVYS